MLTLADLNKEEEKEKAPPQMTLADLNAVTPKLDLSVKGGQPTRFNLTGEPVEELRVPKPAYLPMEPGYGGAPVRIKQGEYRYLPVGMRAEIPGAREESFLGDVKKIGAFAAGLPSGIVKYAQDMLNKIDAVSSNLADKALEIGDRLQAESAWPQGRGAGEEHWAQRPERAVDKDVIGRPVNRTANMFRGWLAGRIPSQLGAFAAGEKAGELGAELGAMGATRFVPYMGMQGGLSAGIPGAFEGLVEGTKMHALFKLASYAPGMWTRLGTQALMGYGLAKANGAPHDEALEQAAIFGGLGAYGEMKRIPLKREATPTDDMLRYLKAFRSGEPRPEPLTRNKDGKLEYVYDRPRRFELDQPTGSLFLDASMSLARMTQDASRAVRDNVITPVFADWLQKTSNDIVAHSNLKAIENSGVVINKDVVKKFGGAVKYLEDPAVQKDLRRQVRAKMVENLSVLDKDGQLKAEAIQKFFPGWTSEWAKFENGDMYHVFTSRDGQYKIAFSKENPEELLLRAKQTGGPIYQQYFGQTLFPEGTAGTKWHSLRRQDLAGAIELTGKEGIDTLGHELFHLFARYSLTPKEFESFQKHFENRNLFWHYAPKLGMTVEQFEKLPWEERAANVMGRSAWQKQVEPYQRALEALKPGAQEGPVLGGKVGQDVMNLALKIKDTMHYFRERVFGGRDVSEWSDQLGTLRRIDRMMTSGKMTLRPGVRNVSDIGAPAPTPAKGKGIVPEATKAEELRGGEGLEETVTLSGVGMETARAPVGQGFAPGKFFDITRAHTRELVSDEVYAWLRKNGINWEPRATFGQMQREGRSAGEVLAELANNKKFMRLPIQDRARIMAEVERGPIGYDITDKNLEPYSDRMAAVKNEKTAWKVADTWRGCGNFCISCYANKMAVKSLVSQRYIIPVDKIDGTLGRGEILRIGNNGDPATDWGHSGKVVGEFLDRARKSGNDTASFDDVFWITKLQSIDGIDPSVAKNMEVTLDPLYPGQLETTVKNVQELKSKYPGMNIVARIRTMDSLNKDYMKRQEAAAHWANSMGLSVLETRMRFVNKDVMNALELNMGSYHYDKPQFKGETMLRGIAEKMRVCNEKGTDCIGCGACLEFMFPNRPKESFRLYGKKEKPLAHNPGAYYSGRTSERKLSPGEKMGFAWDGLYQAEHIENRPRLEIKTIDRARSFLSLELKKHQRNRADFGGLIAPEVAAHRDRLYEQSMNEVLGMIKSRKTGGGGGGRVAAFVSEAVENVRDYYAGKEEFRELAPLIDALAKSPLLKETPILFTDKLKSRAAGTYWHGSGRVDVSIAIPKEKYLDWTGAEHVANRIVHEAMHAATLRYGLRLPRDIRDQWYQLYRRAVDEYDFVNRALRNDPQYPSIGRAGATGPKYGFRNFREFIAELVARDFRGVLKGMTNVGRQSYKDQLAQDIIAYQRGSEDLINKENLTIERNEHFHGWWDIKDSVDGNLLTTFHDDYLPPLYGPPTADSILDYVANVMRWDTAYKGRDKKSERNREKAFSVPKYEGPNPAKPRPIWEGEKSAQIFGRGQAEGFGEGKRIITKKFFTEYVDMKGYLPRGIRNPLDRREVDREREQFPQDFLREHDTRRERAWFILSDPKNRERVAADIYDMVENANTWATAMANVFKKQGNKVPGNLRALIRTSSFLLQHYDRTSGPVFIYERANRDNAGVGGQYGPYTGVIRLGVNEREIEKTPFFVVHEAMHGAMQRYWKRLPPEIMSEWIDTYQRIVSKGWGPLGRASYARGNSRAVRDAKDIDLLSEYGASNEREAMAELVNGSWAERLKGIREHGKIWGVAKKVAGIPLKDLASKQPDTSDIKIRDGGDDWDIIAEGSAPVKTGDPISAFFGGGGGGPMVSAPEPFTQGFVGAIPKDLVPWIRTKQQALELVKREMGRSYLKGRDFPTITAAQKRVASIMEPKTPWRVGIAKALDAMREGTGGKLMTEIVDRWHPLLSWQRQVEGKTGSKILMKNSPYWAMIGMGGREGLIQLSYDKLRDITKGIKDVEGPFTQYLVAKRLMEREKRGADNPQGVDYGTAHKTIDDLREQLGPEKFAAIEQSAQRFWDWADKEILARLRDAHVISEKSYQKIKSENKNWLPFERSSATEELEKQFNVDARNHGDDIMPNVDSVLQTLKGMRADAKIRDPWETILHRLHVVTNFAERNKALLKIAQMRNMDPSVREYVRRIKPGQELPPNTGQFGVVINGKVVKYSAPLDIVKSLQTLAPREMSRIDDLFRRHRNIFTLGTTGMYLPFTIFNIPRDFQMATLTSRHKFNIARWMYGLMHALPSSFGFKTELYKDYLKAQAGGAGLTEKMGPRGGEMGFTERAREGQRPEAVKQLFESKLTTRLRGLKNPVVEAAKFTKSFTGTFELATRLGVFAPARKDFGPNRLFEAGMEARRSTIDFNRGGTLIKLANDFIPFLNASVQAKANMFEALFGDGDLRAGGGTGPFGIKEKDARAAAWDRAMLWMVLPTLGAYFYNRTYHDDEYRKLDEDYKSKFIPIMIGQGVGEDGKETVKFVPVPKDDFLRIMTRPMEKFLDWAWKKDPVKWQHVAMEFLSNLSPVDFEKEGLFNLRRAISGVSPPGVRAAGVFAYGKDPYWDRELIPERLANSFPHEQYTKETPEIYKTIGKVAHKVLGESAPQLQSPLLLEAAARQFFGNIAAAPTPGSMWRKIKNRAVREVPTTNVTKAMKWDRKIDREYTTARLKAERILEKGFTKRGQDWVLSPAAEKAAAKLMMDWNNRFLDVYLGQSKRELGDIPGSTWQSQYTIDADEWDELKEKVRQRLSGERTLDLERRFGFRIK